MRLFCRAVALACVAMITLLPLAHADETPPTPTFELAGGAIDLDGTAWTWTGSLLVVFGPVGQDGRPIRMYDPHTGEVWTSAASIPVDGSHGLGRAVSVDGMAYLLGLPRDECHDDTCIQMGTDDVYIFDPATDSVAAMHVENSGAFMGLQPVAAGRVVYAVSVGESGMGRIWHLDTESMAMDFIEVETEAHIRAQHAAVWIGTEIVLLGSIRSASENGTWSNFVAFNPIDGTSRNIGTQGFATLPSVHGAAWDGHSILMVGARTSGQIAPDNQLVWLDPATGELQMLAPMPGGMMPAGLIFDGMRFLAVGAEGRCVLTPGQSLWIDPVSEPPDLHQSGQAPVAVITVTHGSYSKHLGQFWVEVDACSSTDDGLILRAEVTHNPGTYWQQFGEFRRGTWLGPGEHEFMATVWDDEGMQGSATHLITLSDALPHVQFTWKVEGLKVHADGSTSTDNSGPIERFYWEWGDGTTDDYQAPNGDPLPPQPIISHTYAVPGTYNITLIARAPDGQSALHTETILVGPASTTESHDVPTLAIWGIVVALVCASRIRARN